MGYVRGAPQRELEELNSTSNTGEVNYQIPNIGQITRSVLRKNMGVFKHGRTHDLVLIHPPQNVIEV